MYHRAEHGGGGGGGGGGVRWVREIKYEQKWMM